MRELLPFAAMTSGTASQQARDLITLAAQRTSVELVRESVTWLNGPTLGKAVRAGQVAAARQIKVAFGGINARLLRELTIETTGNLLPVAASPQDFAKQALRKSQALVAAAAFDVIKTDQALTRILIRSTLAQETSQEMSKRVLKETGLEAGDRILLVNGQQWEAEAYAKMLTRTRGMEALNRGKATELLDNGYEFIETSEHDVKDKDDICNFLQGKVWALTENDKGIPMLPPEYGLPPWHPNCSHTFAAFIPEFNGGDDALDDAADSHADDADTLDEFQGSDGKYRAYKT